MSTPTQNHDLPRLNTPQLTRCLERVVLIDAHGPPYFAAGHIPGAVNIPPHDVARRTSAFLAGRTARLVVYGARGSSNAMVVADQLIALGYTDVALYEDGLEGWIAAGLPIAAAEPTNAQ